jgi:ABC-type phosphate transport system substrate-binding protein
MSAIAVFTQGAASLQASADTDSGTLVGEGGTFLQPVVNKLMQDDSAALAPLSPGYTNVDLDEGIADFVGTGQGQFNTDFAVSERPLTQAETQTATSDGRSFAYVPFAATPVAIGTLAPLASYSPDSPISTADMCPHIPLTLSQLDQIY